MAVLFFCAVALETSSVMLNHICLSTVEVLFIWRRAISDQSVRDSGSAIARGLSARVSSSIKKGVVSLVIVIAPSNREIIV